MLDSKQLLGARIKELRKARNLSQEKLAERVGLEPKQISRIEGGKSSPSMDTLEGIARELQVEVKELFDYQHLKGDVDVAEEIGRIVSLMDDKKRVLALRLLRVMVN